MSLEVVQPGWLLVIAVAVPWLYFGFRRSLSDFSLTQRVLSLLVRLCVIALVAAALARVNLLLRTTEQFVVFLVDASKSIGREAHQQAETFVQTALRHRGSHRAAVVYFAARTGRLHTQWPEQTDLSDPDTEATDIERALLLARAQIPPGYVPRLVLLSDGRQTRGRARQAAASIGIPVDTVALPGRREPEVQVAAVSAPSQVPPEEPFYVDVQLTANRSTDATVRLYRNGLKVAERRLRLKPGTEQLRFRDQLHDEKLAQYQVSVQAEQDTFLDNNRLTTVVYSRGQPRVLVVEQRPELGRHLARALRRHGLSVEVRPPRGLPASISELLEFDAVVLSNVPATALTVTQMENLRTYVERFGGGFIMVGGDESFGLGGYYRTVLEQILPVRCDIQREQDKPVTAMVLIIDKSGSMGGIKIEMAKEAARNAVELLGPRDLVGVIAFEGAYYWLAELQPAANRAFLMDAISRLEAGGGTAMYPPMVAAYEALQRASAKIKHVILLTDGISAPGDFEGITTEMRSARITVSAVGVGPDHDADLLQRIAELGNGRYYRTDDPEALPQIFAKETARATKSALNEEPTVVEVVRPSPMIDGIDLDAAPLLLGYVITQPKPTSEVVLAAGPGHPLLAYWRFGLGLSVAFTSDVHSRWAAEWLQWPDFGAFWAQVVRFAMRREESLGTSLRLNVEDDEVTVRLDALSPDGEFLHEAETELYVLSPDGSSEQLAMSVTAPGRFEARFRARSSGSYQLRITQRLPDGTQRVLNRVLTRGYSPELRIGPPDRELLRDVARLSGGEAELEPSEAFRDDGRYAHRPLILWPWLLGLAMLLFVADVALRRIEWFGGR